MQQSGSHRQRIVVGVDGSEPSAAALRWASDEALRRAALLEAVIAWRPTAAIAPPAGHPSASTRSVEERHSDAESILNLALREIDAGTVEIERKVMRGTPHRVLQDAARGASMLVIGGRTGPLAGKLPWSTGRQVVHEARCPVVVVPTGANTADAFRDGRTREAASRARAAGIAPGRGLPG
jgi:nucleotide-binding universal stress UspA family protein